MDTIYVRSLLEKCWSDETAITNGLITIRQYGQCLTTALLVQELFGGYVLVARARGESHYLNEVDGTFVDLAADHEIEFREAVRLDRPELLKLVPKVAVALEMLRSRFESLVNQPRPIAELDYVAIVDEAQLCGGLIDPTAEGIVLAGPTREAVFDDRFYPGQRVWFKLRTGGVVSNALLDRWICVPRRELSHADIHAFLRDCRVPRDKGAWLHKIVGGAGWVCLLRVQPDEILDVPSTPAARARLRSLVTLDTPRRRLMWLHDGASPPRLAEPSSLSPFRDTGGLRYHFRWEHLLDIDVTVNIDERCRPGYRFAHRVAVLNRMLSLFASVMSEYQHVVRQQFTGTEIDLVAECLEHLDEVPLERVLSFLPDGIAAVAQQQARLQSDCADEVAILAERVRWLSVAERAALIDLAFVQNGVIPWSLGRKSWDEDGE